MAEHFSSKKVHCKHCLEKQHKNGEPIYSHQMLSAILVQFLKTLENWKEMILNFVASDISNAVTEGLNNLIRYMRRFSFGLPSFEHMRLRILASSP